MRFFTFNSLLLCSILWFLIVAKDPLPCTPHKGEESLWPLPRPPIIPADLRFVCTSHTVVIVRQWVKQYHSALLSSIHNHNIYTGILAIHRMHHGALDSDTWMNSRGSILFPLTALQSISSLFHSHSRLSFTDENINIWSSSTLYTSYQSLHQKKSFQILQIHLLHPNASFKDTHSPKLKLKPLSNSESNSRSKVINKQDAIANSPAHFQKNTFEPHGVHCETERARGKMEAGSERWAGLRFAFGFLFWMDERRWVWFVCCEFAGLRWFRLEGWMKADKINEGFVCQPCRGDHWFAALLWN